ncbi:MAG: hybrid sensor histidine kinase/response regulator [Candidatus Kapabacteria bacterium]|nr:hybrid sensor histidine kinase/response regulator [Candidatus Kapabacteria bacterium]
MSQNEKKSLVLVVDDNPANIQVVGENLRKQNVEISIATNSAKSLKIAKTAKPDLIILDVMMPDMDGYEVCEKLKEDPDTKDIPVIFVTAKVNHSDIIRGFELGAVDYVLKPFNAIELQARVNTHLRIQKYLKQIKEQNDELINLNNEKNEFLGIAAHDLKNPIYNISLIAKMIRDDENISKDDLKEFSTDLVITSNIMLDLINNLLDINKIEQGKVKINIEETDLFSILVKIINNFQDRAAVKKVELLFETENEVFVTKTDKNALLQILDNLISNAIKFSELSSNCKIKLIGGNPCKVEIIDQGPGFTEDDMKKIYGKFARLSAQPVGNEQSTGLGLSIVKKYIDLIDAKISLESKVGSGSKFTIVFPKI